MELKDQSDRLIKLEKQVKSLTTECSAAKQDGLFYQQMSEQHAEDLSWLLKQGVASCVRDVLNSQEFGNLNALCQAASIQVGLTHACLEMKDKYPLLANEPLLYSYPTSQDVLLDRFMEATGYEYHLLRMLKAGSMDVGSLKKFLEENENGGSSQAPEDKSSEVELLIVEEQLKVPDGKITGEAKQAVVTDVQVDAQVLVGEDAAGDGDGKGDGVMGSDVENLVSPNVETVGRRVVLCPGFLFRIALSYIKAGLKIAVSVMAELTVPGHLIDGLMITGLAIAGLAITGFAMAGLAIAGFAIAGLMVTGLAIAGLAIAGFAMAGLAIAGFAIAGLMVTGLAIAGFAIAGLVIVGLVWIVRC
ncbi:hypothetical protein LXL04_037938 [Taraxacum kok-saghyz]